MQSGAISFNSLLAYYLASTQTGPQAARLIEKCKNEEIYPLGRQIFEDVTGENRMRVRDEHMTQFRQARNRGDKAATEILALIQGKAVDTDSWDMAATDRAFSFDEALELLKDLQAGKKGDKEVRTLTAEGASHKLFIKENRKYVLNPVFNRQLERAAKDQGFGAEEALQEILSLSAPMPTYEEIEAALHKLTAKGDDSTLTKLERLYFDQDCELRPHIRAKVDSGTSPEAQSVRSALAALAVLGAEKVEITRE